jgi:hypothetical protein
MLHISEVAQIFGPLFSTVPAVFGQTIGWATVWATFFTNSSGHPARPAKRTVECRKCPNNEWTLDCQVVIGMLIAR